eukprot:TRINITY_DN713_c0_g1_i1.p1 TRINITY_DN713_c0_g1~~TRINITY_DN713_c0_g1_i1.p1  ORF type:complete len:142 (-),score=30.25 TRINITY_DN713_c0_g1_i1:473-865(-)
MSMRTIDDELDEVISGCFTTLESFFAEHAQLQPMMKKSFFELSQARRASVEVGRTSFDMAMVALTTALWHALEKDHFISSLLIYSYIILSHPHPHQLSYFIFHLHQNTTLFHPFSQPTTTVKVTAFMHPV